MTSTKLPSLEMERGIARCRLLLSATAMLAIYIDPTEPTWTRWLPLTGGSFVLNPYAGIVLLAHLTYSLALVAAHTRLATTPRWLATFASAADVLFGAAVALVTEGATSAYDVFFAFAVLSVGLRRGLRAALVVTGVSLVFYTGLSLLSAPTGAEFYVMRAAYLGMTGYLVGYFGQERLNQEARLRTLEALAQRERIARSLHDGYAQALSGVNLRIGTCQELFRRGRQDEAVRQLTELQAGVNREHDELRAYIHSLVERETPSPPEEVPGATRFAVTAEFAGGAPLVEHVLHIMLEGARNVTRHARARSAEIRVRTAHGRITVAVDDDGVGFDDVPWSIASRAAEVGGVVTSDEESRRGGHLRVELPAV